MSEYHDTKIAEAIRPDGLKIQIYRRHWYATNADIATNEPAHDEFLTVCRRGTRRSWTSTHRTEADARKKGNEEWKS